MTSPLSKHERAAVLALARRLRSLADAITASVERDDPYLTAVYFNPWLVGQFRETFEPEARRLSSRLRRSEAKRAKELPLL